MPELDPVDYALRYGGRCRDCADGEGTCHTDGTPCDPVVFRAVAARLLAAWRYGIDQGLLGNPFKDRIEDRARDEALEEAAKVADGWLEVFGAADPEFISAKTFAGDAVRDIAEAIRERIGTPREREADCNEHGEHSEAL